MITYRYKLNMTPGGIPVRCKLGQYDDDWAIVFSLYSHHGNFSLESGTTARIRGTKKDGLGYSADAVIDITNKTVTVTGDKQITAAAGANIFELVLYQGTKELSTANIIFDVERAAMDAGTLVSDSQVQEILDMSEDVIAASENLSVLRGNFAPTYSDSSTYAVGDYVLRNNQLYRCTTAITTAESWTSAHWKAVSSGGEQNAATKKITTVNANLNGGAANLFLEAGSFNFPRTGGINWTGSGKRCITPKETWLYLRKGDVITATNDVLFSCVRVDSDFNRLETVGENTYNATVTIETPGRHILQLHYDGEQVPLTPDVAMRNTTISCNGLNETISDLLIEEGGAYE